MMKFFHLSTHWTPDEAHIILSFLDELRDTLWQAYGDDIVEHYRSQAQKAEDVVIFDDDEIPF